MGGRSKRKENHQTDAWQWLTELSDDRLDRYMQYASIQDKQEKAGAGTAYMNTSTGNLLLHLEKELEHRRGKK